MLQSAINISVKFITGYDASFWSSTSEFLLSIYSNLLILFLLVDCVLITGHHSVTRDECVLCHSYW